MEIATVGPMAKTMYGNPAHVVMMKKTIIKTTRVIDMTTVKRAEIMGMKPSVIPILLQHDRRDDR
jgi:hypothetical protein